MAKEPPRVSEVNDLTRLYFNQVTRSPLLTKTEEIRLAKAMQQGRLARQKLAQKKRAMPKNAKNC